MFFEIECQFHYFLFAGASNILDCDTLFVVSGAHIVKFLLEFSVFEFVLLFFGGRFVVDGEGLLVGEIHGVGLAVEFGASFGGSLAFDLEGREIVIVRFYHLESIVIK